MERRLEKLSAERQKTYGDFRLNMAGTSQQIAGMLTQMLSTGAMTITDGIVSVPPWTAPLFLAAAVKGNRIAGGVYHADNFDDEAVYMRCVESLQEPRM